MNPSGSSDGGGVRPTIETIARVAGVSISTVSRALRNHSLISKARCLEIQKIARELGYTPNPYVSTLMSHLRTARPIPYQANITIVDTLPSRDDWKTFSVQRKFHAGAEAKAAQLGYKLDRYWVGGEGSNRAANSRTLLSRGIRGVIVPPLRDYSTRGADLPLTYDEFACVTVGCKLMEPGFHFSTNDQYAAGLLAHDRLWELGYRRVGLAIPEYVECIVERRFSAGFRNSQERRGRVSHRNSILRYEVDDAREQLFRWLRDYQPEAVCVSFPFVKDWIVEGGWRVPEDLGVAVLDWSDESPELSGVDQKSDVVGGAAVELLVQLLQRNELGPPATPFGLTIEGHWVDGATAPGPSAPAPTAAKTRRVTRK